MTKEEIRRRTKVLEQEIDSTEEELKYMLEEVQELYNLLDEMKENDYS